MIEIAHDTRTREIYRVAREERARVLARAFAWLFSRRAARQDRAARCA